MGILLADQAGIETDTNERLQKILPPLNTFVVRRFKSYSGDVEDMYVVAHTPMLADGVLVFQTMSVDPNLGLISRSTRGFSSWIDFEIVPMASTPAQLQ